MKILKRSTVAAAVLASLVAAIAGIAGPADAIIGGADATQLYPGVVAPSAVNPGIGVADCGGALIAPQWVLTAAHCVSDHAVAPTPAPALPSNTTIRIGSNDRTTGGVVVGAKQIILHPDWAWGTNPASPVSDLALVKLARPVNAPLMRLQRPPAPGGQVRAIGWGLTVFPPGPDTQLPAMLQQRDTTILPATRCGGDLPAGAGEICLGTAACFGDSGSPALYRAGREWVEVGLASRETVAADPCGQPMVYTDPSYGPFRKWIWTTILTGQTLPCTCPPAASTPDRASLAGSFRLRFR